MRKRLAAVAACVAVLAGCASSPPAPASVPMLDAQFPGSAQSAVIDRHELFRLDPALERALREPAVQQLSAQQKLNHLVGLVYGDGHRGFGYRGGHSTVAAETLSNREGDCLSLTVLTYAAARALGLGAQMQEVAVPPLFDRRGTYDVVNQHVNVLFPRLHRDVTESDKARDVVMDFEPDFATARRGVSLNEDGIVARFYNNIGVEALARGDGARAYAHFKAALAMDPAYAATYGNMAALYRSAGRMAEAEQMLRKAVSLDDATEVPLQALHQMLLDQGRNAEAAQFERMLEARRDRDPYWWIGRGVKHLHEGEPRKAVDDLKQARDIAPGFPEIHQYLAIAYMRIGERALARDELRALGTMGPALSEAKLALLKKKVNGWRNSEVPAVQWWEGIEKLLYNRRLVPR